MLTLIQFIQLPEQKRLTMMKVNVIESNTTDQNLSRPSSRPMSFKQFAQDWLEIITKYADDRFNRDSQAVDAKADASRLHPEPVVDQRQPTGEAHATTRS